MIPRNVRISEAPSYGKPVLVYDLKCVGSEAYLRLATEIIQRERAIEGGWMIPPLKRASAASASEPGAVAAQREWPRSSVRSDRPAPSGRDQQGGSASAAMTSTKEGQ